MGITSTNINYRDYSMAIGAGQDVDVAVNGDYWQVIKADAPITLVFDNGSKITRSQGMGGPQNYTRVRIGSDTAQSITIALGETNGMVPYDARQNVTVLGATASITPADLNPATAKVTVPADGAAHLLIAANPKRLEARIRLISTAPNLVFWGDADVLLDVGNPIEPGDSEYVSSRAAIYVCNPAGGAPVDVYIGELNTP